MSKYLKILISIFILALIGITIFLGFQNYKKYKNTQKVKAENKVLIDESKFFSANDTNKKDIIITDDEKEKIRNYYNMLNTDDLKLINTIEIKNKVQKNSTDVPLYLLELAINKKILNTKNKFFLFLSTLYLKENTEKIVNIDRYGRNILIRLIYSEKK